MHLCNLICVTTAKEALLCRPCASADAQADRLTSHLYALHPLGLVSIPFIDWEEACES